MRSKRALSCFIFSLAPLLGLCGNLFSPLEMPKYDPQKARLGGMIFKEVKFSGRSCESCHNFYLNDSGASVRDGQVPTILNSYYIDRYLGAEGFASLKDRILTSLFSELELGAKEDEISRIINENLAYKEAFYKIYGEANVRNLTDALAEFLKSKTAINSKFDRFLRGEEAFSEREYAGYVLFVRLCSVCHNGVNLGTSSFAKLRPKGAAQPGNMQTQGLWSVQTAHRAQRTEARRSGGVRVTADGYELRRVPSLRNITQTAPYINGEQDLRAAVGRIAKELLKYDLSETQMQELLSFLATLRGEIPRSERDER